MIHVVLDGKGRYQAAGNEFELKRGDVFAIYPGEETVYRADRREPWRYIWVGIHGYRIEEFLTNMGLSRESPVIRIEDISRVETCMKRMLEAKRLTVTDELMRMSQLLEIMSALMEEHEKEKEKQAAERDDPGIVYVKYAMDYIRNHFRERVKIDDIADLIGISRNHLASTFKKEFQMSPQEYLISVRLEHAAVMLIKTTEPINVVALESGYEDSSSFSKAFKQKFKVSPREYRNSRIQVVSMSEKGGYERCNPL